MRRIYLLGLVTIALIASGCTTLKELPNNTTTVVRNKSNMENTTSTPKTAKKNDPLSVSFLTNQKPKKPFVVLGLAKVSKYNPVGIKRQEATLRDILREDAASLGGDAIVNIKHDDKTVTATIIAYKNKNMLA